MNGYGRGEDNRKKEKLSSVITRETFGMTILLFSVVLLVISAIGSYMLGEIGVAIDAFLMGIFGYFLYPFLFFCVALSLRMITGKKFFVNRFVWLTLAMAVSVFLIVHLATSAQYLTGGYGEYLGACWNAPSAASATGGGVVLAVLVWPVQALLSRVGAYFFFSLLVALSAFLFLWNTPLKDKLRKAHAAKGQTVQRVSPSEEEDEEPVRPPKREPREQPTRNARSKSAYESYSRSRPQPPVYPQEPQNAYPQYPQEPQYPQYPEYPQYPQYAQYQEPQNAYPQYPQEPQNTQYPQYSQYDRSSQDAGRSQPQGRGGAYNTPYMNDFDRYTPPMPQSKPVDSMDILYGDPASSYYNNLIFNRDYNSQRRRSSILPDDSPARANPREIPVSFEQRNKQEPRGYEPPKRELPSYNESYSARSETVRPPMPRRIVEEHAQTGLNYSRQPSYKAPDSPDLQEAHNFYDNDVPYEEEFSSAPNVHEPEPQRERVELRKASPEPRPEPVKSEPRPEPVIPEETAPSSRDEGRDHLRSLFSVDRGNLGREIDFERAARDFGRQDPPARDFGREEPLTRDFGRQDPPARDFGREEPISRDFGRQDPPARDFGREEPITRDFGRQDPPARDFGREEPITRDFGRQDPPARDFGREEPISRDFGRQDPPARDFGREEPISRDFGRGERDFGREPVMGFSDRETNEDAGDSRAAAGLSRADLFDDEDDFDAPSPRETLRKGKEEAHPVPATPAPRPQKHVYRPYVRPSFDLFRQYDESVTVGKEEIDQNSQIIMETLAGFRVDAEIMRVAVGPSVTRYDIDIPKNISVGAVTKRDDDVAMRLHARDGVNMYSNNESGFISIEVPNKNRAIVGLRSILRSDEYLKEKPGALMFAIGKDLEGRCVCGNIAKMKHILVAGATGSGKSVCLNAMLVSLLCKYSPEDLRIILIDPKKVEFAIYDGLPHLMINEIIADAQKAVTALNWAIKEMERRYELFEQKTRSGIVVRELDEYNQHLTEDEQKLPKIVIVVDELADLMAVAKKDIEERIQRLTQKARAAGIHLVIATQRPSVDVITGVIKGNLPTRMAFRVIQEVDSRTILDESGAQKLLGNGDMLYRTEGMFNCLRVQGAFLSSAEVQAVLEEIKATNEAYFDPAVADFINNTQTADDDGDMESAEDGEANPEYIRALGMVVKLGQASISLIQRKCSIGYNHAGKIIEWMELMGYISPFDGKAKARTVLLTKEEYESKYGPLD